LGHAAPFIRAGASKHHYYRWKKQVFLPTIIRHQEHADFIEVATPILRGVFPYSSWPWTTGEQMKRPFGGAAA